MAKKRNLHGKVVIKFLVDSRGRVQKPTITKASPKGVFEKSALEAIGKWRFKPAYHQGKPVSTWVIQSIVFKLK
jgi:protein TonB